MTAGEAENVILTVDQAASEGDGDACVGAGVADQIAKANEGNSGNDSPDLPTFLEEREERQKLQDHSDHVEGLLEETFKGIGATKDEEEKMPDVLEKMDQYKRIKDNQISQALPDLCQQAEFHKERGNEKMKESKFTDAFNAYKAGFDLFQDFAKVMLDSDARRLVVALYSNASQALLKCDGVQDASTEGARQMAEKALDLEPTNTKALFRRGLAYAKGGDTNLALDDFQQVMRLDPENTAARKEIRTLQAARREQKRSKEETLEQKALRLETEATRAVGARDEANLVREKAVVKVEEAEAALAAAQCAAQKAEEDFQKAQKKAGEAEAAAKEARRQVNGEA